LVRKLPGAIGARAMELAETELEREKMKI